MLRKQDLEMSNTLMRSAIVVSGAPGSVGVFEATALALLEPKFSPGIVLSAVAFYRLISV